MKAEIVLFYVYQLKSHFRFTSGEFEFAPPLGLLYSIIDSIYILELTSDEYLWLTLCRTRIMTKMTTYGTQRKPWVVLRGLAATIA